MKLPGLAAKIYTAAKAVVVYFATGKRSVSISSEYYGFDLTVHYLGFSFPLAVAVDVINANFSSSGLILFLVVRDFWRSGHRVLRYAYQARNGLAGCQAEREY